MQVDIIVLNRNGSTKHIVMYCRLLKTVTGTELVNDIAFQALKKGLYKVNTTLRILISTTLYISPLGEDRNRSLRRSSEGAQGRQKPTLPFRCVFPLIPTFATTRTNC